MEYILIPVLTLLASILTFFSGFGLGTIMLPVFAIFFLPTTSVVLTAIVHFVNNLFKLLVLGKHANKLIVLRFGIPALMAAFLGAFMLKKLSNVEPFFEYVIFRNSFFVSPLKVVIALLIIFFAIFELYSAQRSFFFNEKYLLLAGLLSGFLGGLSGHQGALRSAFLIKCNMSKESFIGTSIVIACFVDIARITSYGYLFGKHILDGNVLLLFLSIIFALLGVFIGNKLLKKITYKGVQIVVVVMLIFIGVLLGFGII